MAENCPKFRILSRNSFPLRLPSLLVSKLGLLILPVLIRVAFVTLLERKLLSLVGLRLGPNKVSLIGFLQPLGDAVKLANKQSNSLSNFNSFFYYLRRLFLFLGSLTLWVSFRLDSPLVTFKFFFLLVFSVLSVNSICSILAGWRTFSKFSLIGRVRTVSQLISYESALYFCIFSVCACVRGLSYQFFGEESFRNGFIFLLPFFFVWVPCFLAELNRTPYDFSEGERELVRGFNTEFGSSGFTVLFLSEYSNIIFFSSLTAFLFFSRSEVFSFFLLLYYVIWIRSVLPRYRFDKLMLLAWKFFIPFLTFIFIVLIFFSFS